MNKLKTALLCFCLGILLSACNSPEKDPVEITFIHGWGSTDKDHVAMRGIYSDFEKQNPDIKLNMLSMPTNNEMKRLVEDMLNTGNIPDVIFTAGEGENSIFRFMEENGLLLDLMPYVNEDEEFSNNISPIIKEMWTKNGSLYTVSDVLILSGGYWYNREIFEGAGIVNIPKTWNEFYEMLNKLKDYYGEDSRMEAIRPSTDAYLYIADNVLFPEGGMALKGELKLSKADFERVCRTWKSIDEAADIDSRNYSYRDEAALFNDGRLALYINGVWAANAIKEDIDAGYALLPTGSGTRVSCQSTALGYLLGKTGDPEKMEASVRFIKYMLSVPVQKRILLETQQVPENPNINIDDYYEQLERFCLAVKTIQEADKNLAFPHNLWSEEQRASLENNLSLFLEDKITGSELGSRVGVFN